MQINKQGEVIYNLIVISCKTKIAGMRVNENFILFKLNWRLLYTLIKNILILF